MDRGYPARDPSESSFSVGTLSAYTSLAQEASDQMLACEDILTDTQEIEISSITLDAQDYYQGQCGFESIQGIRGAITANLSREIEKQKIGTILNAAFMLLLLITLGSCLLFGTITVLFMRIIITPITTLTTVVQQIASSDFSRAISVDIQHRNRKDEFGVLARAFIHMQEVLLDKMAELQQLNAKLDQQIAQRTTELDALQHLLLQIIEAAEHVGRASDGLTHISAEMAAGAEQTSHQITMVSANSQQISQRVHDVSSAAEQVASNIREISENVEEVTKTITNAVEIANAASSAISGLQTNSQEIGKILEVIATITQQTNLLALNATIEAARAGDSGKGFKVVANEVKELAHQTADSAEDINHKIEMIQQSSHQTADAITKMVASIYRGSDLSQVIDTAIQQQSQGTNEISQAISEAAYVSQQISEATSEVATSARDSSERAMKVQLEAQTLLELAEQLRQSAETSKV